LESNTFPNIYATMDLKGKTKEKKLLVHMVVGVKVRVRVKEKEKCYR